MAHGRDICLARGCQHGGLSDAGLQLPSALISMTNDWELWGLQSNPVVVVFPQEAIMATKFDDFQRGLDKFVEGMAIHDP